MHAQTRALRRLHVRLHSVLQPPPSVTLMFHCTDQWGCPLPLHGSFICPWTNECIRLMLVVVLLSPCVTTTQAMSKRPQAASSAAPPPSPPTSSLLRALAKEFTQELGVYSASRKPNPNSRFEQWTKHAPLTPLR